MYWTIEAHVKWFEVPVLGYPLVSISIDESESSSWGGAVTVVIVGGASPTYNNEGPQILQLVGLAPLMLSGRKPGSNQQIK